MSIQEHKKKIRIVSIIFIVAFLISSLYGAWTFIKTNIIDVNASKEVIATINKEKIYLEDYEQRVRETLNYSQNVTNQIKSQLSMYGENTDSIQELPEDIIRQYVLLNMIDETLLLSTAKDLKVKVSNSEINSVINDLQSNFNSKDEFILYITQMGYNLTTLKDFIRKNQLKEKVEEKMQEQDPVTEEEIVASYERYKLLPDRSGSLEENRDSIEEMLKTERSDLLVYSYLDKMKDDLTIEFKEPFDEMYNSLREVLVEKDGYKITRSYIVEQIVNGALLGRTFYEGEETVNAAIESASKLLDNMLAIKNEATEAGITSNENYYGIEELKYYSQKYYNYIVDNYQPSDSAMRERFENNRDDYNIKAQISGYVLGIDYSPSNDDEKVAKEKAETLMKELTVGNFADVAKENSEDPMSAINGGLLGEMIDVSQFVPEFAEAVQKGKAGEIVGPVKTSYGYHIIYIKEKDPSNSSVATVSHILIMPVVSEATKIKEQSRLKEVQGKLESGEYNWNDVISQDKYNFDVKEKYSKITKSDYIPGIGADTTLTERMFNEPVNKIFDYNQDYGAFLIMNTESTPARQVSFDESKPLIRLQLAIDQANEKLKGLN